MPGPPGTGRDRKYNCVVPPRVRFAPSPTGYLHVGGARTAIYNELLRASLGGAFVLRIEDTDRARSDAAMTEQIKTALAWIGVEWDEGPHLQSERLAAHRAAAEKLLAEGKAYPSFATQEELEQKRREATATKGALRYRDVYERPSPEEVERRLAAGEPYSVRFPLGDEDLMVHDFVRGDVEFKADVLDDFVILRSDGTPTYHLSVVCDDVDMGITHVIRGEDHLSNTPKHVALFRALGAPVPAFGHLPLILGPDKKRLSKRTGATSVEEFRDQGYLPQALYNYLALLGWSPGGDREIMSRGEMVELFTAERLGASASVFDHDKLAWMNAQYMSGLPLAELLPHLEPFLAAVGLADAERERLHRALEVHRTRAKTLAELAGYVVPYFVIGIFVLPLLAALFFGRVFCGGVCPLGAIQEVVLVKPVTVPPRLDRALGACKWVYLAAAVGLAAAPVAYRDFVICRFDPFVSFFRFTGTFSMLLFGGLLLTVGLFVGRPYCRYLCPYGALLALMSRVLGRIGGGKEADA